MPIDLHINESPAAIATYHDQLSTLASDLTTWADTVNTQRTKALSEWEGNAADMFGQVAQNAHDWTSELHEQVNTYAAAVQTFHDSVTSVQGKLHGIRDRARTGGLVVNGESITLPPSPTFITAPGQELSASAKATLAAYDDKVALYNQLSTERDEDLSTLYEAHLAFRTACEHVEAPAGLVVGQRDTDISDVLSGGADLSDAGSQLMDGGVLALMARWGRYAPRDANGRFRSFASAEAVTAWTTQSLSSWVPKAGRAGSWSKVAGLVRGAKFVEGVGWVLTAVSAGIDAKEQWDLDSHDPTLDTAERIVRSGATVLADDGPQLAGALAGAAGGAAIGAAVGGPVGAVVGGLVGGFIGSGAGEALSDWAGDTMHSWIDGIRW